MVIVIGINENLSDMTTATAVKLKINWLNNWTSEVVAPTMGGKKLIFNTVRRKDDEQAPEVPIKLMKASLRGKKAVTTSTIIRMPIVYDQGQLGSCVSNATAYCYLNAYRLKYNTFPSFRPSRLQIYYATRWLEQSYYSNWYEALTTDGGAFIHDGIAALTTFGIIPESLWPYTDNLSNFYMAPGHALIGTNYLPKTTFKGVQVFSDSESPSSKLTKMKNILIGGNVFMIGVYVYESFMSSSATSTGNIQLPNESTEDFLGGHALCFCGFNDSTQRFTFVNSWGSDWGASGYGTIPYSYLTDSNLAGDCYALLYTGKK